jgi:hypothetical protein
MSTETTISPFLSAETEQPDNNHSSLCTKPLPAQEKAEHIDLLLGLCLLGTQGQKALVKYIQAKQARKYQKGSNNV